MKRTAVNHLEWSKPIFNQGEVIEGATRILHISGQIAAEDAPDEPFGLRLKHPGDMRAQFEETLAQIDQVLESAGMTRNDLTSLTIYVTDVSAALENFDVFMNWVGDARPPQSMVGVASLVMPDLMIEISGTAAR